MSELVEYELPDNWTWTTVGSISHVEKAHIEPKEYPDTEFNYLSIENVESETGNLVRFKPTKGRDIGSSKLKFTTNDILYSKLRPYLNKVHIPTFSGISATDLIPIRPEEKISREYLAYYLRTQNIMKYLNSIVHGIQLPRVSVDDILITKFPLAPSNEQKRIVSKIEELSKESKSAREALDKIPQIMKKFRQSTLVKVFSGNLVPQDPNDKPIEISSIKKTRKETGRAATIMVQHGTSALSVGFPDLPTPHGWKWVPLLDVAELASGHTPSRNHPEYWNGDIPWVTGGDATEQDGKIITKTRESITRLGINNSAAVLLPKNTVCLSREASIGDTVILGKPMATNQRFVNFMCSKKILPKYLLYLFLSERSSLYSFSEGTTHKTIYFPKVKAFHVCVPPINEQERIVNKIEELFSFTDQIEKSVEETKKRADRIDQAILAKAFRGELVPQDPHDEPASVLLERITSEREKKSTVKTTMKLKNKS